MLDVLGGLGKLAGALGKGGPAAAAPASAAPARPAAPGLAADSDATLPTGIRSGLGLEPAVTLEGIASTLNRIYGAQAA